MIAGKGHEKTQEIAGVKHPFVDLVVARSALARRSADGRDSRSAAPWAVSYTHLDVYKRQLLSHGGFSLLFHMP